MKIGYPCVNRSIGCSSSHSFRLGSYSETRMKESVRNNLECLTRVLLFNAGQNLLFFRISSDLVPFASHPVCNFRWQEEFQDTFREIGDIIRGNRLRISMHPDQFVLINSPDEKVHERSVAELRYHNEVMELMGLDSTARIQVHVGGVYNDRQKSLERFVLRYDTLDEGIRSRLVIENDDRLYRVADCLYIHEMTGIPVLFDELHHSLLNHGERTRAVLLQACSTWKTCDGLPMVDYSSQQPGKRPGAHAEHIDEIDFSGFLIESATVDIDIMLEIKDKEKSAISAIAIARNDPRFHSLSQ